MDSGRAEQAPYDLVVIGAGVNGAGIARDAAGRGLKVLLCEKDDIAQHASSASTKLIHGGLRYLANYDFKLVRHSLKEREVLREIAPHIIWPMRFVLPHHSALRPRWLIRLGLFLYDHLAPLVELEKSKGVDLRRHAAGRLLKSGYTCGFEYSDCWVQDSRLVVLNAMDAKAHGAQVLSRTRCTGLTRADDHWQVELSAEGPLSSLPETTSVRTRAVINAAGPWVDQVLGLNRHSGHDRAVRLIRGSHIVVRRLFDHPYAYIFQNRDKRILFCIPYENDYTLIGTTEVEMAAAEQDVRISDAEIDYLCRSVNVYLRAPVSREDVVWSYSGMRPLFDDAANDASKVTRDFVLNLDDRQAPIVSVYGGKITTYRVLAEGALALLRAMPGFDQPRWTRNSKLSGGQIGDSGLDEFARQLGARYDWLPDGLSGRYARHYGTCAHDILKGCSEIAHLGRHFAAGLYQGEVDYLIEREFARCAEDIIWRRTRLGLRMTSDEITALGAYVASRIQPVD